MYLLDQGKTVIFLKAAPGTVINPRHSNYQTFLLHADFCGPWFEYLIWQNVTFFSIWLIFLNLFEDTSCLKHATPQKAECSVLSGIRNMGMLDPSVCKAKRNVCECCRSLMTAHTHRSLMTAHTHTQSGHSSSAIRSVYGFLVLQNWNVSYISLHPVNTGRPVTMFL